MEQKILICYLHEEFIGKLLSFLFPENFDKNIILPNNSIEIYLVNENKSFKIKTCLGLNQSYKNFPSDIVYIEKSLVTEETKNLLEDIKKDKIVEIYELRKL